MTDRTIAELRNIDPTLPLVLEGFDPPEEEARPWLDRAGALGLACSREVFGEDFDLHLAMVAVVRVAAATLWRTSRGEPCWSRLDVGAARREMVEQGCSAREIGEHFAALASFYAFLVKHGHLTLEQGEPLLRELFPFFVEHFERGGDAA
ncbi:MAG: hypothetical protein RIF41_26765 [Polyangiaceae bacterium]